MLADAKCFCMRPSAGCLPTARCPGTHQIYGVSPRVPMATQAVRGHTSLHCTCCRLHADAFWCCWGRVALLLLLLLPELWAELAADPVPSVVDKEHICGLATFSHCSSAPYFRVLRSRVELGCSCSLTGRSTLFPYKGVLRHAERSQGWACLASLKLEEQL